MGTKHDNSNCGTCRRLGLKRKAHRIMADGTTRCDEHFREECGLPQLTDEARCFIEKCHEREREKTDATQTDRCGPAENAKAVVFGIELEGHRLTVSRERTARKKNSHGTRDRHSEAHTARPVTVSQLRRSWEEL